MYDICKVHRKELGINQIDWRANNGWTEFIRLYAGRPTSLITVPCYRLVLASVETLVNLNFIVTVLKALLYTDRSYATKKKTNKTENNLKEPTKSNARFV